MKTTLRASVLGSLLLLGACSAPEASGLTEEELDALDPNGHRLVSTTVALTEMTDALDIDLIGQPSSYKTLPKRYKGVPEVGNPMSPDMELVLALQPKRLLSVETLRYDLEDVFEKAGVDTHYANLKSIDRMLEEIDALGETYDRDERAKALRAQFEDVLSRIETAVEGKEKPRVLILMGVPGSYLIATEQSYIGDLVRLAGGENVFADETVDYIAANTEFMQQTNPDIILRAAHGMPDEVVDMFDEEFRTNDIWRHFDAVKNERVYDLEERIFGMTASLAAEEALETMYRYLYEEELR